MKINARYLAGQLKSWGWSSEAIAGVLGNMETESTINPGIWQNLDSGNMSLGYGLVQWTPATKYINWATSRGYDIGSMAGQIARIMYEVDNNIQWIHPSMTFSEFIVSNDTPYNLAGLFLAHYERPAEPDPVQRGKQANFWYEVIEGIPPTDPTDPDFDYSYSYSIMLGKRITPRRRTI